MLGYDSQSPLMGNSMFTLLLLVCAIASTPSAHNTYHVKPTLHTPCPNTTCHTISEYVSGANHFFTGNTTLVFLPGEHALDGGILAVANIGSFAMVAEDSSTIATETTLVCANPGSFVFVNISDVEIRAVNITSCGIHPPNLDPIGSNVHFVALMHQLIAVLVQYNSSLAVHTSIDVMSSSNGRVPTVVVSSVSNFNVTNCSVDRSYAPFFISHSQAVFEGLSLEDNRADCGGGLFTVDSIISFEEDSIFIGNTAVAGGGGVYAYNSHILFQNIRLENNTGEYGGALCIVNSTINLKGDSIFTGNTAGTCGGGVFGTDDSHLIFQNVTVEKNTAEYGGGMFVYLSTIDFKGNGKFIGNSARANGGGLVFENVTFENSTLANGGGLHVTGSTITFEESSTFVGNSAETDGGGLYSINSTVNFEEDSTFTGNPAGTCGGGVYGSDHSHLIFQNMTVEKNTAEYGGGMFVYLSTIDFKGNGKFIGNSARANGGGLVFENVTFENSTSASGGGLHVTGSTITFEESSTFVGNSAETNGGGLYLLNSTVNFEEDSTFTGNPAGTCGGGVFGTDDSHLIFQNVTVEKNTAEYGGGMFVYISTIDFKGNSTFIGNSARANGGGLVFENVTFENSTSANGGGLHVTGSTITFEESSTFVGNSAETDGGGLYLLNSTVNFEEDSTFTGNPAGTCGGGVYGADHSHLIFQNVTVEKNTAEYGGGMFVYISTIDFKGNGKFIGNSARANGGGLVFENVTFENSTSANGGGLHVTGSTITFEESSTFVGNSAETDGGGLYLLNSTVNFEEDSTFTGNPAGTCGGGVYGADRSHLIFQNVTVEKNTAEYGGGMFVYLSTIDFKGNGKFIGNSARANGGGLVFENVTFENSTSANGGGLHVTGSTITFEESSTFVGNSAETDGGGLYLLNSTVNFEEDSTFTGNPAGTCGGGVYGADHSHLIFQNVTVEKNTAEYGGGMFVYLSTIDFKGNGKFIGNSARANGGGLVFENVTFENSTSANGGGLHVTGSTITFEESSTFVGNSAETDGGGLYLLNSTINFEEDSTFTGNNAGTCGGGVYGADSSHLDFKSVTVENNAADYGGGIFMYYSNLNLKGFTAIRDNYAKLRGGGIIATDNSHVVFHNVRVENNTADHGGGLFVYLSTLNFERNSTFMCNFAANSGGGIFGTVDSHLIFQDVRFDNNTADYGGGMFVYGSIIDIMGENSRFENNTAAFGAGLFAFSSVINLEGRTSFMHNSATEFGGGLAAAVKATLTFSFDVTFCSNYARIGGAIYADDSKLVISGNTSLLNNIAWYGGAINLDASQLNLSGSNLFEGNSAEYSSGHGGAINSIQSDLTFNGSVSFTNNTATYGGGLALSADSAMYLLPNSTCVHFERNHADVYGGAILFKDDPFSYCVIDSKANYFRDTCFIQVALDHYCHYPTAYTIIHVPPTVGQDWDIQLVFENNSAVEAGSVLYGGTLDTCGFCVGNEEFTVGAPFLTVATSSDSPGNVSTISSDPFRVCLCNNSQPDCSQRIATYISYPGETFSVPVVAVGQRNGIVPALINTDVQPTGATIDDPQHIQEADGTCTPIHYTVFSSSNDSVVFLTLFAEGPCGVQGDTLQIEVSLSPCPEGFALSKEGACSCEERLLEYTTVCDINDRSIEHVGEFWVGYDNQSRGLILHPHCPFDYCKPGRFSFTLVDSDKQCNQNRSGILCGACQPGFSIILGSSQCSRCSNKFLAVLIPIGIAGLALVTVLFMCKFTVAAGTFSGLLFYANIIAANQTAFFPPGETNALTIFIAWLNLDLGIKTCFFDGMDTYSKTWLQFAFPFYIWLLVGMIVMVTRYSQLAARIIGNTNPVSVLATLFLLSYTKLLRIVITALSLTTLEYQDKTVAVWAHDGNIGYLDTTDAKHISIFMASLLVFLFLFLPYTLVLIFGQCIQARSNHKMLWWANNTRIRSFLDAYHAPYKNSHRYWIGLLLMVRFVLFIISAISDISSPQDPSVNLLVIVITTLALSLFAWNTDGIYKKWYLNVLESSFIFNLSILAATTLYVKAAGGNQAAVVCSSVGFAFTTFFGIVCYHIQQRLLETRMWRWLRWVLCPKSKRLAGADKVEGIVAAKNQQAIKAPTCTVVDLREPLDLITDN